METTILEIKERQATIKAFDRHEISEEEYNFKLLEYNSKINKHIEKIKSGVVIEPTLNNSKVLKIKENVELFGFKNKKEYLYNQFENGVFALEDIAQKTNIKIITIKTYYSDWRKINNVR